MLAASLLAAPARAADPETTLLTGYNLTSWTQKDGIESPLIFSLAQDSLGYLWLGTETGALRFDGVRFVPWQSLAAIPNPSASVRSIFVSRDGAMWFGLGEPGGIVVLRNGTARSYGPQEGLPDGIVMSIVEGSDGTIWAGGRFGLHRLSADRWQRADDGLPPGIVNALLADGDALFVAASSGVFRRGPADPTFEMVGTSNEVARSLVRDRHGRLWVTDPIAGFRDAKESDTPPGTLMRARGSRLLYDSHGNLWIGTGGQGLWRLRHTEKGHVDASERTSTATGLSDDGITELIEDREGNVWAATRDGLNRFTPHKMTPITDIGVVNAIDATRDGRVWVGTVDGILWFEDGRIPLRSTPIPLRNPPLTAMHADASGTLWAATATELVRVDGSKATVVPLKRGAIRELTDITSDGEGGLWIHDTARGLLRWKHGSLTPGPLPEEFVPRTLLASHTDREGRAWFSFAGDHVAVIDRSGAVRLFDEHDGLTVGPYRAIHQDQGGAIWFGGDGGLTRFATGVFTTLPASPATPVHRITGIIDDEDGALWLAVEAAGILRLSREEIAKGLSNPAHTVRYSAFDKMDGSAGTMRWFGNRAAVRAGDGRLWFVAGRGVTVVDPQAVGAERPRDDKVRIEGAVVDGAPLSAASAQVLPPGTARVQVDYTVLDLTSPQKRRFRHRLDGFDPDWIDAGTRHSAFYTNLPPRDYTFRVMATDADGAFTDAIGEWRFRIRPAFYQTWWFAAACLGAAALSIGAAWRVHVLRMRKQFSLLLGERARLSREVHDTLLQSMFGYALQFDALAEAVGASAPHLHERLAGLRHQVEDDIREARQSIWNLRSPMLERQDLPSTLKDVAEHAVASTSVDFDFDVGGAPRRVSPQLEEQLLRIGREAVSNCVRHAHATRIKMSLDYGEKAITLTVADDGQGFDAGSPPEQSEHFGLTTMRERAESVGGSLLVRSGRGQGTTVTATVPTT